MSDEFRPGDWAARVDNGPENPRARVDRYPAINRPVLVLSVRDIQWMDRTFQGLTLQGFPVYPPGSDTPSGWWNGTFFRKVPPPDSIEEPRRAAAPVELEPA